MNRAELVLNVRTGRDRLEAALAQVDERHMTDIGLRETWSVKDLLAHLGWWEQRAAYVASTLREGQVPEGTINATDVDQVNATVYQEHHQQPLVEVRHYEHDAYLGLLTLVEKMSENDLFDPQRFPWTKGQPLADWVINNTYGHYDEHMPALLAWIDHLKQHTA